MIDKEKYDKISDNVVKSDFSNVLYVRFDDNVFLLNRTNRNIEVTKTENEIVIKCKEEPSNIGKRSIASTFHHLCPSAIIVSYYTQSKKFSTRLF